MCMPSAVRSVFSCRPPVKPFGEKRGLSSNSSLNFLRNFSVGIEDCSKPRSNLMKGTCVRQKEMGQLQLALCK